jgi:predicted nucleic acid-binding protein
MQAVSNTSPINYLLQINEIGILQNLYGRIVVPHAVIAFEEIGAGLLIIDERAGRTEAKNRGLLVTGTSGVLEKAANLGLVNLAQAVSRLLATNFRIRRNIVETLAKRHESR